MSAISLSDAIALTQNYRDNKDSILDPKVNPDVLPICESFDRADFDALLAQTDCQGIRIYMGMDKDLNQRVVAVGVNSDDEDILTTDEEIIIEKGVRCPDVCPPSSSLNS